MPTNIQIKSLQLTKFKRVDIVDIDLGATNVLVGGNNSGKSSVLQGIHFSVCAAVASRLIERNTFAQSALLYCPAHEFVTLRHGSEYLNQSNFSHLTLKAEIGGNEVESKIKIYRGRNEGNIGCTRTGNAILGAAVTTSSSLFSIYVPGLAGIPRQEEYRTESVIRRGIAGGDANLYLRNVLFLISKKKRLTQLVELMQSVFPRFWLSVSFNEREDVYISVTVSLTGPYGSKWPLELSGTGVLQALQIFSYVTLFEPSLLLLDEPDAHLHPDNQGLLASTVLTISLQTKTQVILSTHSRHLVEALYDEANFIWLKEGRVIDQGIGLDRLPLLLDLGALDTFDKLRGGEINWVVLTEDSKLALVKTLLESSGFDLNTVAIYSYKTSTNIQSALALCGFIKDVVPMTHVIIHRDRDFMTDQEVKLVQKNIIEADAIPFITLHSDLEGYFLDLAHLAMLLDKDETEIKEWLDQLAASIHNKLQHSYTRKRDQIKQSLYRKNPDECPETIDLIGDDIPLDPSKRLGKTMLKLVRSSMNGMFGKNVNPMAPSDALKCIELQQIFEEYTE
ncbi:AAA family ATPase [Methylobacter tundripaludum]|uniref:SMC domain protein n=1 Tax=Methylobacter tundripaludum (strain ATCC BAA-1195 / DSM 17260 / SV96) TaxID=697282 RepID=G3J0B6_METTV|nr:AAA family ATPase [Methylobacter tundripaludum]EGW20638.1 SMC domain protein [Methylobacter tundripaludum SV96]